MLIINLRNSNAHGGSQSVTIGVNQETVSTPFADIIRRIFIIT